MQHQALVVAGSQPEHVYGEADSSCRAIPSCRNHKCDPPIVSLTLLFRADKPLFTFQLPAALGIKGPHLASEAERSVNRSDADLH